VNLTWQAAAAIATLMGLTWLASLVTGNASVVDLVWGLGFVVVGWTTWSIHPDPGPLQHLTVALVSIWGIRLSGYLAWRNRSHGEDFRYRTMREKWGRTFWIVSLGTVFALQGAIMWVVSLPLQIVNGTDEGRRLGVLAVVGALIWLGGFVFEAVGDAQLARFKADPANSDEVMDRGLWAWTRHPNYFGDACVWWGLGIIALTAGRPGVVALIGPATMNLFLVQVSGKALLERSLLRRRVGYDQYVARTSGFLPRPPRSP
jgi:steroid 5-alpha reductase family enzyme